MLEFNSMQFINDIYSYNTKFFINKESNPSNHLLGNIKYVGENLCKELIEINLDEELKKFNNHIKNSYYSNILAQNIFFQDFVGKNIEKNNFDEFNDSNDSIMITEIFNKLSKMMINLNYNALKATNNRSFQEISSNSKFINEKEENLKPANITSIHFYIHEISLLNNDDISVKIKYNDIIIERKINSSFPLEIYEILNYKDLKYIIRVEIFQKVIILILINFKKNVRNLKMRL